MRFQAIDAVRGLAIVLMVLDHTRDYFSEVRFEPTDLGQTNVALFLTRWVTHFCAPSFVFLAGTSAYLVGQRRARSELRLFLLTRGVWLVLLEFTLVNFVWHFNFSYSMGLVMQVIWALGMSMCCLALLTFLPDAAVVAVGLAMIAGHNSLDAIAPRQWGAWAPLWNVLHVSGRIPNAYVVYPLVPWVGVMAVGYGAGKLYLLTDGRRQRALLSLAAISLLSFVLLRAINQYGDPAPWVHPPRAGFALLSFLNVSKYPPSLDYLLVMLGPMFLALWLCERLRGPGVQMLAIFGRVPLFAYVLHLFMVHALAGVLAWLLGHGTTVLTRIFMGYPAGWGFGLPGVYLTWLVVLCVLYPTCRRFAAYKASRGAWWLSYL